MWERGRQGARELTCTRGTTSISRSAEEQILLTGTAKYSSSRTGRAPVAAVGLSHLLVDSGETFSIRGQRI